MTLQADHQDGAQGRAVGLEGRADYRNRTRERLEMGQPVFGCFLRYPDSGLAELLALRGLDFVVFDGEHGVLSPQACEHLARAVQLHGVTPVARVEENRAASILRYLDAGVLGCHVPGIESADDAARAVRAVKFRPQGGRGLAASRGSGFGPSTGYAAYTAAANREIQVIVHIESAAGVEAVDEIAMVEGVDVLLIGTLDLSDDLGCPGELDHPRVTACIESAASAVTRSGKTLGAVAANAHEVHTWLSRGARYLVTTVESLLAPGIAQFLMAANDLAGEREES